MTGTLRRLRPAVIFCLTATVMGGCDLSTKGWALQTLSSRPGQTLSVVEPWLEFSLAYNRGTAFSVIPRLGDAGWLFALLALAICVGLLVVAMRRRPVQPAFIVALGVVAGGAVGNGWDRAFRTTAAGDTAVIDFIRVNITPTYSWPTFNLADAWILLGVVWLFWLGHRAARSSPPAEAVASG